MEIKLYSKNTRQTRFVKEEDLPEVLLELAGGGYNPQQVAESMAMAAEFRKVGEVSTKNYRLYKAD